MRALLASAVVLAAIVGALPAPADAWAAPQLRVSPGPLARPHASLEGVGNCGRCHESTRRPSGARCLACHQPIAQRMARRQGVHRDVTGDCGKCHAEHGGEDVDLRRIDRQTFDHAVETGFGLDGEHARLAATCASCHKKRSFLGLRRACESCHADPHKATLGHDCAACHSTRVPFKQTRRGFDHARARFLLTGAHREVRCEKCHAGGVFRGLRFEACSSCHASPHRRPIGPTCSSCHATDRWFTRSLDHAKTAFPLVGAHAQVACARCHLAGVRQALHFDRCGACHANVHRDSVRDDCGRCHTPASFRNATFDHRSATKFALEGQHARVPCRKCHARIEPDEVPAVRRAVDFGGVKADCAACHADRHKGEYGLACEACHRPVTFKAAGFAHPRSPEFFGGRHAGVTCVKCHVRPAPGGADRMAVPSTSPGAPPSMACVTCHADVHLGQLGSSCDRCHDTEATKFAPVRFAHDAARFQLAGAHRSVPCGKCHTRQTAGFPAGAGAATRFRPLSAECASCHKDPHLGQVSAQCETCHTPETFRVTSYTHRDLERVFSTATHGRLPCRSCHRIETGQFPAGRGTAVRLRVGRTCLECHP
jgi:hypothetical protein